MDTQKLSNLIQAYISAKNSDEFGEEINYHERMENYRTWLRENILDHDRLTHYSDSEFAQKFGEMFDHTDGAPNSQNRNRIIHFKTNESRLAVRNQFENLISYIIDPKNDRFELLEITSDSNSPYKVPGIGPHVLTSLINAKYPDIPPINTPTRDFFANIGEPLPAKLSSAQRTVSEFFNDIVNLSNGELNLDDANHILWYTQRIESGRKFMEQNYAVTFETKAASRTARATRKKVLTREEQIAETYAHLKAIQEQSARKRENINK